MSRFDIVEAYFVFSMLWHSGGLTDRCRAKGRGIDEQLWRMKFRPSPALGSPADLEEDGREVYLGLVEKYHPDALEQERAELEAADEA